MKMEGASEKRAAIALDPSPGDFGILYDQTSDDMTDMLGGYIHAGYWENPNQYERPEVAGERLTREVGDRLSLSQGQHILDVGCGTGKSTVQIATTYGVRVTGITISKQQVEIARTQYGREVLAGHVHFQFTDAMDMPFADASFDSAYAIESLVHMLDKRSAIAQIARVLRPGGRLVIADLVADHSCPGSPISTRYAEVFRTPPLASVDDLRKLLSQEGFKVTNVTDIRENVRPTNQLFKKKALSLGGEFGQKLLELSSVLEQLQDLGYALIIAERL
jgi:ubiquinone/menaquinone biosynthesis C-methylase UbiE